MVKELLNDKEVRNINMGVGYTLVNIDKKEQIDFYHVDTGTKLRELCGTTIASAIVTYYWVTNSGDRIGFISDTEDSFIVCRKNYKLDYFINFVDVTENINEELIEEEIIKDNEILWINKENNLFNRDLINIGDPKLKFKKRNNYPNICLATW